MRNSPAAEGDPATTCHGVARRAKTEGAMLIQKEMIKLTEENIELLEDSSRSTLSHVSNYMESYQVTCHNAFGCRKLGTDRCAALL